MKHNADLDEFRMTEQHIKLLRNMYVGWQDCETGAPEIDPKRPYGNSDVDDNILDILEMRPEECPHCHREYEYGDPLPKQLNGEHNALEDAKWLFDAYQSIFESEK